MEGNSSEGSGFVKLESRMIDKLVGANPEEMRKRIDAYVETIHVMAVVLASDGDKFRRGSWFLWFIVSQIM
ncbi:hypothetical protein SDJN03_19987, partial [Cucurbita argyrosperma subsp. sororia]